MSTTVLITFLAVAAIGTLIDWLQSRRSMGAQLPPPDIDTLVRECYHPVEGIDDIIKEKCTELLDKTFPDPQSEPLWNRIDLKMKSMNLEDRKVFVKELTQHAAQVMHVKLRDVKFEDFAGYGCFRASDDSVTISNAYLQIEDEGVEVVKTIFHELKHAVQFQSLKTNGNVWGYPVEVLAVWANNFQNYVNAQIDPEGYFTQPIELDAFGFETTLIPKPNNTL